MKIYLAGRYGSRTELQGYRRILIASGFEVTSRWLDTNWNPNADGVSAAPRELCPEWAEIDFADVLDADMVVSFTSDGSGRGGRHVEFGIAMASKKILVLIGKPENIFHMHQSVNRFTYWDEFRSLLEGRYFDK